VGRKTLYPEYRKKLTGYTTCRTRLSAKTIAGVSGLSPIIREGIAGLPQTYRLSGRETPWPRVGGKVHPQYSPRINAKVGQIEGVFAPVSHSDVTTTMTYLHVLNRGGLGVRSPFDRLTGRPPRRPTE